MERNILKSWKIENIAMIEIIQGSSTLNYRNDCPWPGRKINRHTVKATNTEKTTNTQRKLTEETGNTQWKQ